MLGTIIVRAGISLAVHGVVAGVKWLAGKPNNDVTEEQAWALSSFAKEVIKDAKPYKR